GAFEERVEASEALDLERAVEAQRRGAPGAALERRRRIEGRAAAQIEPALARAAGLALHGGAAVLVGDQRVRVEGAGEAAAVHHDADARRLERAGELERAVDDPLQAGDEGEPRQIER